MSLPLAAAGGSAIFDFSEALPSGHHATVKAELRRGRGGLNPKP